MACGPKENRRQKLLAAQCRTVGTLWPRGPWQLFHRRSSPICCGKASSQQVSTCCSGDLSGFLRRPSSYTVSKKTCTLVGNHSVSSTLSVGVAGGMGHRPLEHLVRRRGLGVGGPRTDALERQLQRLCLLTREIAITSKGKNVLPQSFQVKIANEHAIMP